MVLDIARIVCAKVIVCVWSCKSKLWHRIWTQPQWFVEMLTSISWIVWYSSLHPVDMFLSALYSCLRLFYTLASCLLGELFLIYLSLQPPPPLSLYLYLSERTSLSSVSQLIPHSLRVVPHNWGCIRTVRDESRRKLSIGDRNSYTFHPQDYDLKCTWEWGHTMMSDVQKLVLGFLLWMWILMSLFGGSDWARSELFTFSEMPHLSGLSGHHDDITVDSTHVWTPTTATIQWRLFIWWNENSFTLLID